MTVEKEEEAGGGGGSGRIREKGNERIWMERAEKGGMIKRRKMNKCSWLGRIKRNN